MTADAQPISGQHWKFERGFMRDALRRGVSVRALRTLARIGVHAAGHQTGTNIRGRILAERVGRSRRSVQRDLAEIRAADLPGVTVERTRRPGTVQNLPNHYEIPWLGKNEGGSVVWADLLGRSEYTDATPSQQGILVLLPDLLGRAGAQLSASELADAANVSTTTARTALKYWVAVGWVLRESRTRGDGGAAANWYRALTPWEISARPSPAAPPDPAAERRARRWADLLRWVGRVIAREGAGLWDQLAAAVDAGALDVQRRIADDVGGLLETLRQRGRYRGALDVGDVLEVLPEALDRRGAFDAELADLSDAERCALFGDRDGAVRAERWESFRADVAGRIEKRAGRDAARIWWLEPVRLVAEDTETGAIILSTANGYYLAWILDKYDTMIQHIAGAHGWSAVQWITDKEVDDLG